MTDFNVNNYVSVKLTDAGRARHRAEHEQWTALAGIVRQYRPVKEDADGWSRWQLWVLMQCFGPAMHLGVEMPFDAVIRFDEPEPLPKIDPSLLPEKEITNAQ